MNLDIMKKHCLNVLTYDLFEKCELLTLLDVNCLDANPVKI